MPGTGSYCSYCGTGGSVLPWACPSCSAKYCTFRCMNTDKGDHAQICKEEPERKTFSRTYYNSGGSSPEKGNNNNNVPGSKNSRVVCRFFTAGLCTKGLDCSYSHELPVCKHFLMNTCKYGDECWKLHPAVERTKKKSKVVKNDSSSKCSEKGDVRKHNAENARNEPPPTNQCTGAVPSSTMDTSITSICTYHLKGYCKYGKKCFNLHETSKVKPLDVSSAVEGTICEHFQRGICSFGDTCRKMHVKSEDSPPRTKEVKEDKLNHSKEDAQLICEHYQKGICAYGDVCFKQHVKMPLYKNPYGPKVVQEEVQASSSPEYSVDDLFLSDSESEENIVVPKHISTTSIRKVKKQKPNLKSPGENLFEVLVPPGRDTSTSSDESDLENEAKTMKQANSPKKSPPVLEKVLTNAEKKKLKKETKRKKAELLTKEKIVHLKETGNKELKAGNYSSAVKQYSEAIKLCGSNNPAPGIINDRCAAYIMMKRFKDALKDGRKVVEFEPNNTTAHIRILRCCLALGKIDEGRQSACKIVDSDPEVEQMKTDLESTDRLLTEAVDLATMKNYSSAIDLINQGLKLSPNSAHFITLKAKFYALEKNILSARKTLSRLDMKEQNVKTSLYHFVIGVCFYYEDDMERAISGFGEAKRDLSEAKEWHDRAHSMHNAFVNGNRVLKMGGNYSAALEFIDKGLVLDTGNSVYMAKMFFTRALLNAKYERLETAIADCTNTIKYNGHHSKAWAKRGSLNLELERYEEAVVDLTEAHRLKPSPDSLHKLEDAKRRKERASRRKPSHYQVLGVDKGASHDEIKKAYRAKAREFHPDKHANASKEEQDLMEGKMKEIAAANQCLSDSTKKEEYDRKLERMLRNDDSDMEDYDSDEDGDFDFDVEDFFFHLFGIYVSGGGIGGRFSSRTFRR